MVDSSNKDKYKQKLSFKTRTLNTKTDDYRKTKSIKVRNSIYRKLKILSAIKDKQISDIADFYIDYGLKHKLINNNNNH